MSGDTLIVGAYGEDNAGGTNAGAACVFIRTGSAWIQQGKLTASDAGDSDLFGRSVSISGDTAVVGAWQDNHAGGLDAGSAYVFVRVGGLWSQQAKPTASDAAAGDWFGLSVSVDGNTAIVGAPSDDNAGGQDAGAAYVFVRSGTVWTQQVKLTGAPVTGGNAFGSAVCVNDNTALIGAPLYLNPTTGYGVAFVFLRSGAVWTPQAQLFPPDGVAKDLDYFGGAASLSGNVALVGAPLDNAEAGSAYVFQRAGMAWTFQAKLVASDAASLDNFGMSVSINGAAAVVGSPKDNHAAGTDAGSAYVFRRSGTTWVEELKLTATGAAASDAFGSGVLISGPTVLVGANADDQPGVSNLGSAYIFEQDCEGACCVDGACALMLQSP